MKILFMEGYGPEPVQPSGGLESIRTLYEELSKDHETKFIWRSSKQGVDDQGRVHIKNRTRSLRSKFPLELKKLFQMEKPLIRAAFKKEIDEFEPDLIITQALLSYFAVKYSSIRDCEVCIFLRDWELLYQDNYVHKGNRAISRLANRGIRPLTSHMCDYTLENADYVVADSEFTAEKYRERINRDIEVVYEFVGLEDYKVDGSRVNKILHVNPSRKKGIMKTLEIAERLESKDFIIAGNTSDEAIKQNMESMDNVEYLGWIDDMKEVYAQSKIVLMPSVWNEPFGRIPVEAGISGIPTIAPKRGGLTESVGVEELILEEESVESWIRKIKQVEDDYERFSNLSRQAAKAKNLDNQLDKLKGILFS